MDDTFELALKRARRTSEILREQKIRHAIAGGFGVYALVREVDGFAHVSANVDLLIERKDFKQAVKELSRAEIVLVELKHNRHRLDSVRAIFAGERFQEGDLFIQPPLDEHLTYPTTSGFEGLLLRPLLMTKLIAFRAVDKLHVQDLLECNLITPEIERSLPYDLRVRLESIVASAADDLECGLAMRVTLGRFSGTIQKAKNS